MGSEGYYRHQLQPWKQSEERNAQSSSPQPSSHHTEVMPGSSGLQWPALDTVQRIALRGSDLPVGFPSPGTFSSLRCSQQPVTNRQGTTMAQLLGPQQRQTEAKSHTNFLCRIRTILLLSSTIHQFHLHPVLPLLPSYRLLLGNFPNKSLTSNIILQVHFGDQI